MAVSFFSVSGGVSAASVRRGVAWSSSYPARSSDSALVAKRIFPARTLLRANSMAAGDGPFDFSRRGGFRKSPHRRAPRHGPGRRPFCPGRASRRELLSPLVSVPESSQGMGEFGRPCLRAISHAPPSARSHSTLSERRIFGKPASTSPRPGLSPAAVSPRTMPPVRPLAPWPMRPASKTATDKLGSRRRSQAAAARPVKPPPMMATSTDFGSGFVGAWKFTRQGGVPQWTLLADLFPAWRMAGSGVCFGTASVSAGSFSSSRIYEMRAGTMERRACGQSLFHFHVCNAPA